MAGYCWMTKKDLDDLEAPKHVYRWVANAPAKGPRRHLMPTRERADLVLHLRRTFERSDEDGWFLERELGAAMRVWIEAMQAARKRGGIMPSADQIPPERYMEAITASVSQPRRETAELHELAKRLARQGNLRG